MEPLLQIKKTTKIPGRIVCNMMIFLFVLTAANLVSSYLALRTASNLREEVLSQVHYMINRCIVQTEHN